MALLWFALLLLCSAAPWGAWAEEVFTNAFLVQLKDPHGNEVANEVAKRNGFTNMGPVLGSDEYFHFVHRAMPAARKKRSLPHTKKLKADPMVSTAFQQTGFRRVKRGFRALRLREEEEEAAAAAHMPEPTDPYFPYQWYLKNVGQNGGKPKLDLNVEAAWAQGYTGRNITTAIMDDGVDYMHPDLRESYNARASYDFSSNDPYPYPRYTDDWFNSY